MKRCIDLFCGWGGWAKGFLACGYEVDGYDIDPTCARMYPGTFHKADITKLTGKLLGDAWIIVASPPCDDYAKDSMPWYPKVNVDTTLWTETERIIKETEPMYWCIENVRGAVKYHGQPIAKIGSRYLWGNFPILSPKPIYGKWREPPSRDRKSIRSMIPYPLAYSLAKACE